MAFPLGDSKLISILQNLESKHGNLPVLLKNETAVWWDDIAEEDECVEVDVINDLGGVIYYDGAVTLFGNKS